MTVDAAWSSNVVNLALDREGNASSSGCRATVGESVQCS